MQTSLRSIAAAACILAFAGCSGQHGLPTSALPPVGSAGQTGVLDVKPDTGKTMAATPSSLKIRGTLSADSRTFSVLDNQPGFNGTITATTSNSAIATVSPSSISGPSGTFTVSSAGLGTCNIILYDGTSHLFVKITVVTAHGIYVTNRGSETVESFSLTANGNIAPAATWKGQKTQLNTVNLVALDAGGDVFASNIGPGISGSVTGFAPNPTGNAAPTALLTGSNTGINTPEGMYLDSSGDLFVDNANSIEEFAPGATGNVAPTRTISGSNTVLSGPYELTLDTTGNMYVAEGNVILVYASTATGNVAPIQEITGAETALLSCLGVAVDKTGQIYATNFNANTINIYAAGSTGDVKPSTVITSTALNEPYNIALDASGNIYVSNYGNNSITVFAAGSSGAATPTATILGATTGLNQPQGIAVY